MNIAEAGGGESCWWTGREVEVWDKLVEEQIEKGALGKEPGAGDLGKRIRVCSGGLGKMRRVIVFWRLGEDKEGDCGVGRVFFFWKRKRVTVRFEGLRKRLIVCF